MTRYRYPFEDEKLPGSSYIKFTVIEENTTGGGSDVQVTPTFGDSILLYTPPGITISDGVSYGEADFGVLGAAAAGALRSGANPLEAVKNLANNFNSPGSMSAQNSRFLYQRMLANGIGAVGGGAIGQALGGGAGSIIGAGAGLALSPDIISQVISQANQRSINPNTKVLFERVNIRGFSFTFTFIPTSRQESARISEIIRLFRANMYPEVVATQFDQPYLYKYPTKFDITINPDSFTGPDIEEGGENLIRFKPCFLENTNVSYNPNSMAWHADGNPTETQLTLTFKESETLSREDVGAGF
jgi:hypothetical protein